MSSNDNRTNNAPSWPSLYDFFTVEVIPISSRAPIQPKGHYISDASDIYRFTLYWSLVFYTPAFVLCGVYAFCNIAFPRSRRGRRGPRLRSHRNLPNTVTNTISSSGGRGRGGGTTGRSTRTFPSLGSTSYSALPTSAGNDIPLQTLGNFLTANDNNNHSAPATQPLPPSSSSQPKQKRYNERRTRTSFAILVFLTFMICALAGVVLGSAIVGYVLAVLFKAGKFNMSTWIPLFGALIFTSVGFLGLWPSLIDII